MNESGWQSNATMAKLSTNGYVSLDVIDKLQHPGLPARELLVHIPEERDEKVMEKWFKVILEWNEDGGGYTVTVPALPGCITQGDTYKESLERAQEAIEGHIEALKLIGKPVPAGDVHFAEVQVNVS